MGDSMIYFKREQPVFWWGEEGVKPEDFLTNLHLSHLILILPIALLYSR
jgi:hypothetical protein